MSQDVNQPPPSSLVQVSKREMAAISGSRLTPGDIDRVFAAHDANGDGQLDLAELESMMRAGNNKDKDEDKEAGKKRNKKKAR